MSESENIPQMALSWTGGDGAWSDPSHWAGNTGTVPGPGTAALFETGAATAYAVSGEGEAGSLVVDDPVSLTGTLSLAAAPGQGTAVAIAGTGTMTVTGSLGTADTLAIQSAATVVDEGTMTATGGAMVAGTLQLGDTSNQPVGTLGTDGGIEIARGGTLDLFDGTATAAAGITVDAGGLLAVTRFGRINGDVMLDGGTLRSQLSKIGTYTGLVAHLPGAIVVGAEGGTLTAADNVALAASGAIQGTGILTVSAGNAELSATTPVGSVELAGAVAVTGGITVAPHVTLTMDEAIAETVTISANAKLILDTAPAASGSIAFGAAIDPSTAAIGGVLGGSAAVLRNLDLSHSGFALGDGIDVQDVNPLEQRAQVTADYDAASGVLSVLANGVVQTELNLPTGLTGTFAVASDGSNGSTIALVNGPTGQPAAASGALAAQALGFDGSNLTVGVISDALNAGGGLFQDIHNRWLPASIADGYDPGWDDLASSSDEGRAMAEIVHEVAPKADIQFASPYSAIEETNADLAGLSGAAWFDQAMADTVDHLAQNGATIIVDDLAGNTEAAYALDPKLAARVAYWEGRGVVFVAAATNRGDNYYEAPISAVATTTLSADGSMSYAQRFHAGSDETAFLENISFVPGVTTSVHLGVAPTDKQDGALSLDIYQRQADGTFTLVSSNANNRSFTADEASAGSYYAAVTSSVPMPSGVLKIVLNDGGTGAHFADTVHEPGSGTISGHALDPNEITVGAVNYSDTPVAGGTPKSAAFSSGGPGALLTPGADGSASLVLQDKPDLSAPQRTFTSVIATSSATVPTGIGGLADFGGTSAAGPVIAGTAAMMLQADNALDAQDIKALLKDSALAMPDPGTAGSGLVQSSLAVQYAATHVITQFAGGNTVLRGTSGGDTIVTNSGSTTVLGGGGDDTVSAGGQSTSVVGGAGTLLLTVNSGLAFLSGGTGSVTVTGGAAGGRFTGGSDGHNVMTGHGHATLVGGGGGDRLSGGGGDVLLAAAGNTTLLGGTGDTLVDAGGSLAFARNDVAFGASAGGSDTIVGGGSLTAVGGGGDTTVFGSAGSTEVWAGGSAMTDVAGSGHGSLIAGSNTATLWIGAGSGLQDVLAVAGAGGGSVSVRGFRPGADRFDAFGYGAGQPAASVADGSLTLTLADHTRITFVGVSALT